MIRNNTITVEVASESDIIKVRKVVRDFAILIGFESKDLYKIVSAASELARNIFNYAGQGIVKAKRISDNRTSGIELVFIDDGPGIRNVAQAMSIGYSTGRGLGMGLPGSKRLMGYLAIESTPDKGTIVIASLRGAILEIPPWQL